MIERKELKELISRLQARGAQKVTLRASSSSEEEFNLVYKELNLLRSVESQSLSIVVIKDHKQANTSLNQWDEASLAKAIDDVMSAIESSNADPAFDIAPLQPAEIFPEGPQEMDAKKVVMRLDEFATEMKRDFPTVSFDGTLKFEKKHEYYLNSNGVDFEAITAAYAFMTMFTAKEGNKMSSMNYTYYVTSNLDKPLMDINFTRDLIRQITQQITTGSIPQNFTGDLILSPTVAADLVETLIQQQLGGGALITKSSRFPDHLEQKIFDQKLSIYNKPIDKRMASSSFYSQDGYKSSQSPIIEHGVLKNYPIALYPANKTAKERTMGPADNLVIEAGDKALADMIKQVKQGVLCMRASFGSPNANGDMSSVVKNSYYIENGELKHPLSETMMSLNLIDAFNNVKDISRETVNFGASIFPYIALGEIGFSSK